MILLHYNCTGYTVVEGSCGPIHAWKVGLCCNAGRLFQFLRTQCRESDDVWSNHYEFEVTVG